MGYFEFLSKYFLKKYNDLENVNLINIDKDYYLEHKEEALEKLNKCDTSIIKLITAIVLKYFCIISLYALLITLIIVSNLNDEVYKFFNCGFLNIIFMFVSPLVLIAYFILYFNKSVRKSNCLRFMAFVIFIVWIIWAYQFARVGSALGNFN